MATTPELLPLLPSIRITRYARYHVDDLLDIEPAGGAYPDDYLMVGRDSYAAEFQGPK